jgi:hypothetical protein
VQLSPLYQELLRELYSASYLRTDQIERMLRLIAAREQWPLPEKALRRVVQKKLLALVQAGMLRRITPPVYPAARTGPPFYIYTLAKPGALLVGEQLGLTLGELGWRPAGDESLLFLEHTLRIADYRLALSAACLAEQVTLAA